MTNLELLARYRMHARSRRAPRHLDRKRYRAWHQARRNERQRRAREKSTLAL